MVAYHGLEERVQFLRAVDLNMGDIWGWVSDKEIFVRGC